RGSVLYAGSVLRSALRTTARLLIGSSEVRIRTTALPPRISPCGPIFNQTGIEVAAIRPVSTVPCPLMPGLLPGLSVFAWVHGIERLAPSLVFDPDCPSGVGPSTPQLGPGLVGVGGGERSLESRAAAGVCASRV